MAQPERAADGNDPVADLGGLGIAERDERKGPVRLDLQQRKIGFGIAADQAGVIGLAVVEHYFDLVCVADHMVVGHHMPIGIDKEAGPHSLYARRTALRLRHAVFRGAEPKAEAFFEILAEEPLERFRDFHLGDFRHPGAGLRRARDADRYHGRSDPFDDGGEAAR